MFLDEAEGDELDAVSTYIKPKRQPSLHWQLHDPALTFFHTFCLFPLQEGAFKEYLVILIDSQPKMLEPCTLEDEVSIF